MRNLTYGDAPGGGHPTGRSRRSAAAQEGESSPERFAELSPYRAEREWTRYEGTAQRDLFRELRERFLERNRRACAWTLDGGAGPGRFTALLGGSGARRVALDLSVEMLRLARSGRAGAPGAEGAPFVVRGDLGAAPFAFGSFGQVALLGNVLGFAGPAGERLLSEAERLLTVDGLLLLEIAPGPGVRSAYLERLPASAVGRLFEAPPRAVVPRILREGFVREPRRHRERGFKRWSVPEIVGRYGAPLWAVQEILAVAPALGADPARIGAVASRRRAWARLLETEEAVGHQRGCWEESAAVLVAVRRTGGAPVPPPS